MSEEMKDELQPQVEEETVVETEETAPVEEKAPEVEEEKPEEETLEPEEKEEVSLAEEGKENNAEAKEDENKEEAEEEPEIKEEETKPEEGDPEPIPTEEDDTEKVRAELAELKAQKEDAEALQMCNAEVMKVEQEFTNCTSRIANALKVSFEQNGIDPSKTLEELKKEDPAKATLAQQFIQQATELRTNLEQAAMAEITKQQNNVIYRIASREFEKLGLNMEQAQEAVNTFVRINNEIGISDLGDDLKMKIQLAAGRAKMLHPSVEQPVSTDKSVPLDTAEKENTSVVDEVTEELKEVVEAEQTPAPSEPIVEKPKLADFEEGANAGTVNVSATSVTVDNVLDQMAALPFKERTKFYKEHEDLINEAMRSIR